MSFILQDEIPRYSYPFIDDLPIKSVTTQYENLDGSYETIRDWPECQNLTQVRGFLGVCSVLHIFIRDFTSLAHPLVHLTKKGIPFDWGEPQQTAMQCLKDAMSVPCALSTGL